MKILQINGYESPGRRFHGLAVTPLLAKNGVFSKHLVWFKDSDNPEILTINGKWDRYYNQILKKIEHYSSLQSVLYNNAAKVMELPEYKEADLIHMHIIHADFFSFGDLPKFTKNKPVIWTLHDPWAMTGHCIHPFDCERWKIGCGKCPNLSSPFSMLYDRTDYMFEYKKQAYKKSNFDIIVASQWMKNMVESSPIFDDNKTLHLLPFGIDLEIFNQDRIDISALRAKLGIDQDEIVICFRSDLSPFKGTNEIIEALDLLKSKKKICLLSFARVGLLERLKGRYKVIEMGWLNDDKIFSELLCACDIFLMPSLAEAFGVMAIEAMACSKPVIVFEGTSLPDVVNAPETGIAVPYKDSHALSKAISDLVENDSNRIKRGKKARKFAEANYDQEAHVKKISTIYQEVYEKWHQEK